MKKSHKKLLSILFHLAVLGCMVVAYDAGRVIAKKFGWIESKDIVEVTEIDLMEKEEQLSTEIDPDLAKLVGKSENGFAFRRDIPFPPHIKVIATEVTKFRKVRMAGKSDFGEGSMELSIRNDDVMEYEMAGGAVRFTMKEKASERVPSPAERIARLKKIEEALKRKEKPPETRERIVDNFVGKAVQFNYANREWKAVPTKQFATMAWGKELEGKVAGELVRNSLMPRSRWFGKDRMKIGDVTNISDASLNLVFDDAANGKLEMKLKGMEGVHGHPCAVFEVTGTLVLKETTNKQSQTTNGEVTIEKGRIWCSLIYPIVLRMDLDTIQSLETREGGKVVLQVQGAVEERIHRDWKAVTAKPKAPVPPKR